MYHVRHTLLVVSRYATSTTNHHDDRSPQRTDPTSHETPVRNAATEAGVDRDRPPLMSCQLNRQQELATMRCAIYTRVSTDEQATSEYSSLKRQEEVCRNYIDIHAEKGWKAASIYDDAGYSGKDFGRPGIQELLDDVRAGKSAPGRRAR
jgi:Resolvase, N terminal domain